MSYFLKMDKKVHLGKMDFFVYLDLVRMIFTYSYIGAVHLGEMDFFVHLAKMDFVVEMHPTFVT
jgi:hypothetical protein